MAAAMAMLTIAPQFPPISWKRPSTIEIAARPTPSVHAHGLRPQAPHANAR